MTKVEDCGPAKLGQDGCNHQVNPRSAIDDVVDSINTSNVGISVTEWVWILQGGNAPNSTVSERLDFVQWNTHSAAAEFPQVWFRSL